MHLSFTVGFFGLSNFVGHSLFSRKVAERIGWISNGFQKELGFTSLGIGLCGILCLFHQDAFWRGVVATQEPPETVRGSIPWRPGASRAGGSRLPPQPLRGLDTPGAAAYSPINR